ncbi:hypothetical protein QTH87_19940 [Variovorax sp. J22P168]|uniref:hypothetical protein n=1 Tax=Variovorax jilinensis TaxID=3053513 RepID=UPI002578AB87|nr:hypothetical protein [Variovorax sp. J22P168]MDM0014725.1 hypothetical protein [Variovorax sp. J22P168]
MRPHPLPGLRRAACIAATALLLAGTARADYLWLQRESPTDASGRFGEVGKPAQPVAGLASVRAAAADGKEHATAVQGDRISLPGHAAGTTGDLRLTARASMAPGRLNYYQAKAGRSETQPVNDLELVPTEPGGNTFKLMWKGKIVAATQVNVDTSDGWQRVLRPGPDGTLTLETPFPGLYVLEVTARVDGAATVDGRKYEDVRHTATLSFEVPRR